MKKIKIFQKSFFVEFRARPITAISALEVWREEGVLLLLLLLNTVLQRETRYSLLTSRLQRMDMETNQLR